MFPAYKHVEHMCVSSVSAAPTSPLIIFFFMLVSSIAGRLIKSLLLIAGLAMSTQAHVGSPDVYLDGRAGPYRLFITVRPPIVIPGVAELEIRAETPGVREMRAVPMPLAGEGAKFAPVPDKLIVSKQDPQFFTGSLWMMAPGSWQVRISVDGAQGKGVVAVPVPSAALTTKKMQRGLGVALFALMTFLVLGVVAMVGASAREVRLDPAVAPGRDAKRRGVRSMAITFLIVIGIVWLGKSWWDSEASSYANRVYKPLLMNAALDRGGILTLTMSDPGWLKPRPGALTRPLFVRTIDDLIPDHNHLMHLYAIRQPGLDVVYHLHPDLIQSGVFRLKLPAMPPGKYSLYADIVHASGFPETMVATIQVPPGLQGRPLSGDDASRIAKPYDQVPASATVSSLPDGYRMEWLRGKGALHARQPMLFRFRLEDPQDRAPRDMALYMGMLGHSAFVKTDGTVFAHIHPSGSVSMAALMLAQNQTQSSASAAGGNTTPMGMAGMNMTRGNSGAQQNGELPNEVSFPWGFPTPGRYRIFVQMKHGESIETGVFDAAVQ